MIFAVDFDDTIVSNQYPEIGEELPHAIFVLKKLLENDHKIILYTMRSGKELEEAVNFLTERDVELWAVNDNPEQRSWTSSPKVYADYYIDDRCFLGPVTYGKINWMAVYGYLITSQLITKY